MKRTFYGLGLALAAFTLAPVPAHAQLGKLGDAVKKKAKQAVVGKDDPKPAESSGASSSQVTITPEVLDRFAKGLSTETQQRSAYVKYDACKKSSATSPEYQQVMMAQGQAMSAKLKDNMTDAQKMAVINGAALDMQKTQDAFLVKKCGAPVKEVSGELIETAGVDASGFNSSQYGMLKERITAYCEAVAHGSDTPSNSRIVFTAAEMQTLKPRCSAFLPSLRNN